MIDPTRICVIGAHTEGTLAYGLGNGMPWPHGSLRKDMLERFKPITLKADPGKKNLLLVGMSTANTFSKPLPGRHMIGVSRSVSSIQTLENGIVIAPSYDEALKYADTLPDLGKVFFGGGLSSWEFGFQYASEVFITVVHKENDNPNTIRLNRSLEAMAKDVGFVVTGREYAIDDWGGPVKIEFLDYFRDTK